MHGTKWRRLSLALGLALGAQAEGRDASRLDLVSGGAVEGQVLIDAPDRVVVDLGFEVLTIPADAVRRMQALGAEPAAASPATALYHSADQGPAMNVKEAVEQVAEAVLRVRTPVGLGSGFAIHPDGYVVTNHHVIDGEHDLTLTLFEKTAQELRPVLFENVRIVALSSLLDLALLKIEDLGERRLPVVPLGDARTLVQGEAVFSIGSPLGFDRTVSQGIISLKNRPVDGQLYLQTTVQINPGNSGGPLFDLSGQVIGVNNMKIRSIGIEGLSFAIPSTTLKGFLENVDAYAFDARSPNNGYRYNPPPAADPTPTKGVQPDD